MCYFNRFFPSLLKVCIYPTYLNKALKRSIAHSFLIKNSFLRIKIFRWTCCRLSWTTLPSCPRRMTRMWLSWSRTAPSAWLLDSSWSGKKKMIITWQFQIIWSRFASVIVNLGPTFLSGALAANAGTAAINNNRHISNNIKINSDNN